MGISEQILEMQLLGEYYQLLDIWKCYKIKFILELLKYIKTEEFSTLLIKDIVLPLNSGKLLLHTGA